MEPKAYELRQLRSKKVDEAQEIVDRCEKDKRSIKPDEQERFDALMGEAGDLAKRISNIERVEALNRNGNEPAERRSEPLPHEDPSNTRGTKHRYSLIRAVECVANKGPVTGLEGEVSRELQKRTGKSSQGFMMPYRTSGVSPDADRRTSLDVTLTTSGAAAVQTTLDKDWIELLRNKTVLMNMGAQEILDLQGKFSIPRQSAAATYYFVAENGAVTDSNPTLDQVPVTPHTIGAQTTITRRWFELANIENGDQFVKNDLTNDLARGLDYSGLNGTGSGGQTLGMLQNTAMTTGRTVSIGTNGGVPTWANVVELHTIVSRGNAADLGSLGYVGNADVEGTLATTPKTSTWPVFLLEDGKVYNKRFMASQQLPNTLTKGSASNCSPIIYGAWNQVVMAYWSGVDILVDPFTGGSSGAWKIVALQDFDIAFRHNEAFSFILDLVSNQTQ